DRSRHVAALVFVFVLVPALVAAAAARRFGPLAFVPAAALTAPLDFVRHHRVGIGPAIELLDRDPLATGFVLAESPLAADLLRFLCFRNRIFEITASLAGRGFSDHSNLVFFPLVLEEIAVCGPADLAPGIAFRVAPLAAHGVAFFDEMQVSVNRI